MPLSLSLPFILVIGKYCPTPWIQKQPSTSSSSPAPLSISRYTWSPATITCYILYHMCLKKVYPTFSTVPSPSSINWILTFAAYHIPFPVISSGVHPVSTIQLYWTCFQTTTVLIDHLHLPSSSKVVPFSYSTFQNPRQLIQNPRQSLIFLRAFFFWSMVSLPSLGTFLLFSNFNILVPSLLVFQYPLWFHLSWAQHQQVCFHLASVSQQDGHHLSRHLYPECICSASKIFSSDTVSFGHSPLTFQVSHLQTQTIFHFFYCGQYLPVFLVNKLPLRSICLLIHSIPEVISSVSYLHQKIPHSSSSLPLDLKCICFTRAQSMPNLKVFCLCFYSLWPENCW